MTDREQFEAWIRKEWGLVVDPDDMAHLLRKHPDDGRYLEPAVFHARKGWQAARAAPAQQAAKLSTSTLAARAFAAGARGFLHRPEQYQAQPCPFGCTTQEEHDAHYAPAQPIAPEQQAP